MSKPNPSAIYAFRRGNAKTGETWEEFFGRLAYENPDIAGLFHEQKAGKLGARSSLRSVDIFAARRAACTPSGKAHGQEAGR